MRIGIDLQAAQSKSRTRGIGRYVKSLAHAMAAHHGVHDLYFILNFSFPQGAAEICDIFCDQGWRDRIRMFRNPWPTYTANEANDWRLRISELLYEKFVHDLELDAFIVGSLFEGFDDNAITSTHHRRSRPVMGTILYDLIPCSHPSKYLSTFQHRRWYARKLAQLEESDLIFSISEASTQEAIERLRLDESKISNIGAAASDQFRYLIGQSRSPRAMRKTLGLLGVHKPYIMYVSAFDDHKNFDGLIRAFAILERSLRDQHQLLLVCNAPEQIRKELLGLARLCGLSDKDITIAGYVSDDDLVTLYKHCRLFAFPSRQEGFGLPLVEAMLCGAPVIGANTSSIPGVIDFEDALFDPERPSEIARCIERYLIDGTERDALLEHSHTRGAMFSWSGISRTVIDALEREVGRRGESGLLDREDDIVDRIASLLQMQNCASDDLVSIASSLSANEISAGSVGRPAPEWLVPGAP